jgi:hypothetical protein
MNKKMILFKRLLGLLVEDVNRKDIMKECVQKKREYAVLFVWEIIEPLNVDLRYVLNVIKQVIWQKTVIKIVNFVTGVKIRDIVKENVIHFFMIQPII